MTRRRGKSCVRTPWKHVVSLLNPLVSSVASANPPSSKKLERNTISRPTTRFSSIWYTFAFSRLMLFRSEQMSILLRSRIHWRSNLIVPRVRTSITDGVHIVVLAKRSIRLRIPRFYVRLRGCRICVLPRDHRAS